MRKELYLSTDMVDENVRTDFWREIARPLFDTTHSGGGGEKMLAGSVNSLLLGSLLVGRSSFNGQENRRDRRLILTSSLDAYMVQLFVSGTLEGDCDGRSISVSPGDIAVFDLARSFSNRVREGSTLIVMLPRERVDTLTGEASLHGTVLKAGLPITRLLTDFVISLAQVGPELDPADVPAIEEAAVALLGSSLARHAPAPDPMLAQILRRRVLDFIDNNLTDPELGSATLVRRFRVSRAHLYRMFAADGGVARMVRDRRLDAAYREFRRPGTARRPITEVALELGFSNSSQFLKAFKSRFDMTPSEARQNSGQPTGADPRLADLRSELALYEEQLGLGA